MKKPKVPVPKTMRGKNIAKYIIIIIVLFDFVGALRSFNLTAKINALPKGNAKMHQEVKKENYAVSIGAQTFARNFIVNYFKWNKDDYQERAERLKPYLRKGVDEQAGLRFDTLAGNSSLVKTELWQISDTGKDTALLTFRTYHTVETTTETKGVKGKTTKKNMKSGPFEKWIQVPVITDGKSFLVNGIPTFTSNLAHADLKPIEENEEASNVDSNVKAEINTFLETFFKQYTTGSKEDLRLTTTLDMLPLTESIVFKEMQDLKITDAIKGRYTLKTDALFIDSKSKVQVLQSYNLEVSKSNGRWQVIKFN